MHEHHRESIQRVTERLSGDADVRALILGGSIAHGFATPASDIDVMIVVADADYAARLRDGRLQYYDSEVCTYEGGYVDGKYLSETFLQKVAASGSDPSRFAFMDAQILFSHIAGLEDLLGAIVAYPVAEKAKRIERFYAQFETWHWYAHEALKLSNRYLLGVAVGRLALFGGRLILVHNELLYPYHKWFLEMLARAAEKPSDFLPRLNALCEQPCAETIGAFYESVVGFRAWECNVPWPAQFMIDSELTWMDGHSPVDDL